MRLFLLVACVLVGGVSSTRVEAKKPVDTLRLDDAFWRHWGDGSAELASYRLTTPRYGEPRSGTAVLVFVTETFSESARVKADPGRHPKKDEFPVIKLNLVKDFQTGIYDYNTMTSVFVAATSRLGRGPGRAVKSSFSSQEWCGHVYHHLIPKHDALVSEVHSYFDSEQDRKETLKYPKDGVLGDALFHWAREMAAPHVEPGDSVVVPVATSLYRARILHQPVRWEPATLSVARDLEVLELEGRTRQARRKKVQWSDGRTLEFWVEHQAPNRLVRWQSNDGERADLIASKRLKYWQLNDNASEKMLAEIGLPVGR